MTLWKKTSIRRNRWSQLNNAEIGCKDKTMYIGGKKFGERHEIQGGNSSWSSFDLLAEDGDIAHAIGRTSQAQG